MTDPQLVVGRVTFNKGETPEQMQARTLDTMSKVQLSPVQQQVIRDAELNAKWIAMRDEVIALLRDTTRYYGAFVHIDCDCFACRAASLLQRLEAGPEEQQ